MWKPLLSVVWCALIGIGLFFGIYTQLAAIFGAIVTVKLIVYKNLYPAFVPLTRISSALLLVICISLILTGAGAFAFDLPL